MSPTYGDVVEDRWTGGGSFRLTEDPQTSRQSTGLRVEHVIQREQ
jgi:hypothetical protein